MSHTDLSQPLTGQELVINWHITEACNYQCRYCFARWQTRGRELIHDDVATEALLKELFLYFSPDNARNPLRQELAWDSLRLNIAGGEPLLYAEAAIRIIQLARRIGFKVSLITNGSRLDAHLMAEIAPHLDMMGLSLDALDEEVNRTIGRADRQVLDLDKLSVLLGFGRQINPKLRLKINTVVNALNWRSDMTGLIRKFSPEKWKVLRMLPTLTNDLSVTQTEFDAFIQRHAALDTLMRVENNKGMTQSYLMIDPHGCFFQNHLEHQGYDYSESVLVAGAKKAFDQVNMPAGRFHARYAKDAVIAFR